MLMTLMKRIKEELRINIISLVTALMITVPLSIILTIINQPLAFTMLIIVVTVLIRREVIKMEVKLKWHNGGKK